MTLTEKLDIAILVILVIWSTIDILNIRPTKKAGTNVRRKSK